MKKLILSLALVSNISQAKFDSHVNGFETGTGMFFGRGYDVITNDTKGDCVNIPSYSYEPENYQNSIYRATYSMELIEKFEDLDKMLKISAGAKLRWGTGSAGGSMSYLETHKITKYSLYILVKEEIITHYKNARDPELKQQFLNKLSRNMHGFREACGDEYIVSMTYGGALYGLIRIDTRDEKHHKDLKVSLSGSVGSFSGSASMQKTLTQIIKNKSLKLTTYRLGGEVTPQPTDLQTFLDEIINFPARVAKSPAPIEAFTNAYETIGNFPVRYNVIETSIQEEAMSYLGKKRMELINLRNDIQYINENPSQFENYDKQNLQRAENQINREMTKIDKVVRACFNDLEECIYPEDLAIPEVQLPYRIGRLNYSACYKTVDKICGEIYHEDRTQACGRQARPELCSMTRFKLEKSPACGLEKYVSGTGQACGVKAYVTRRHPSCGCEVFYERSDHQTDRPGPRFKSANTAARCIRWSQCARKEFGVAAWNTCEHESFGSIWKECRDPSHGIETNPDCVETWAICRHPNHGVQALKECSVQQVTDISTGVTSLAKCK